MSNESTSTTRTCKECGLELSDSYSIRCDKCYNRSDNNDETHELALAEDTLRRGPNSLDEVYHNYAYTYLRRHKAEKPVGADDHRVAHLWEKLWDALDGDIERDQTWGLFMDTIPGLPDYRVKTYGGVVTLKFYFSEVEISGSDKWDIERAILDAIEGDLRFGYEDEWEVDYEEE